MGVKDRAALLVCPYFPPSTLAGVHRGRHLAKHLPAAGWRPIVICVDEKHHTERLDPALAELVPASVELIKTGALPASMMRIGGVGDIGLRGFPYLRAAVARIIRDSDPDVVFITGSPYYPMLMAPWIRRRFGRPVVLDFQDPWVSNHGAAQPPWSKAGVAHRLAKSLEPRAVRAANFVTSVSERQNAQMASRYPWLDISRMAAIPIGGDTDDFEALRFNDKGLRTAALAPEFLKFSYVGTCLPRSVPLLKTLFAALVMLRNGMPRLAERIKLNFLGTSNQPNATDNYHVMPIARGAGVADLVSETPQRVPYLEALSCLANSHAILLIGSDEPHYTASKIYPALMSGRPHLSLFHRASSAHQILSTAGGGYSFAFESLSDLAAMSPAISGAFRDLILRPGSVGQADLAAIEPYTARAVAAKFAHVFERAVTVA